MKLLNALSLDVPFHPPEMLGCGHRRFQRGREMRLAKLEELRRMTLPPKRGQDAQMDFHDVKSDSSVASSVTALKFFQYVCDTCGSSIEGDGDEGAPACSSIDLGSANDNDSESSIGSSSFLR